MMLDSIGQGSETGSGVAYSVDRRDFVSEFGRYERTLPSNGADSGKKRQSQIAADWDLELKQEAYFAP